MFLPVKHMPLPAMFEDIGDLSWLEISENRSTAVDTKAESEWDLPRNPGTGLVCVCWGYMIIFMILYVVVDFVVLFES